jgi:hypothetical protein
MMSNNNEDTINASDYLVTEAVDTKNIDKERLSSDLDILNKAEEKKNYKTNITKGITNPKIKRAVSSLRLKNPFKGY